MLHKRWILTAVMLLTLPGILAYLLAQRPAPTPVPVQQTVTPTSPPQPYTPLDPTSTTILELFSPSDMALTRQMNETEITQRIERMFISSFVLVRCNLMDADTYRDTYATLVSYALQSGLGSTQAMAEARLHKIAESASLSYQLVYGRTACDNPQLVTLLAQLKKWRTEYAH